MAIERQGVREHDAWRQLCLQLEAHLPRNRTINDDCDVLMYAVRLWGEEVAMLRVLQHSDVRDRALIDARKKYAGYEQEDKD